MILTANILLHFILIGLNNIEQQSLARSHLDKGTHCNLRNLMHDAYNPLSLKIFQTNIHLKLFLHKLSKLIPLFLSNTVLIMIPFSAVISSHFFLSLCPSSIPWSRFVVKLRLNLNLKSQLSDDG